MLYVWRQQFPCHSGFCGSCRRWWDLLFRTDEQSGLKGIYCCSHGKWWLHTCGSLGSEMKEPRGHLKPQILPALPVLPEGSSWTGPFIIWELKDFFCSNESSHFPILICFSSALPPASVSVLTSGVCGSRKTHQKTKSLHPLGLCNVENNIENVAAQTSDSSLVDLAEPCLKGNASCFRPSCSGLKCVKVFCWIPLSHGK